MATPSHAWSLWGGPLRWLMTVLLAMPTWEGAVNAQPSVEEAIRRYYVQALACRDGGDASCIAALLDTLGSEERSSEGGSERFASVLRVDLMNLQGNASGALALLDSLSVGPGDHHLTRLLALREKARALKNLGLSELAIHGIEQALAITVRWAMPREHADMLILRSEVHQQMSGYDQALSDLIEAEQHAIKAGYTRGICLILLDRGNIHYRQRRWKEAREHYHRALECARSNGIPRLIRKALHNLGSVTSELEGPVKAIEFYEQALAMIEVQDDRAFEARVRSNIGATLNELGDRKGAMREIRRSLRIHEELGDSTGQAAGWFFLAKVRWSMGEQDSALLAMDRCIALSIARGDLERQAEAEDWMAYWSRSLGRFESALEHYDIHRALTDSLNAVKQGRTIHTLEIQYETEKKDQTIRLQELELEQARAVERRRVVQRNALIVLVLALLLFGAMGYRNLRQRRLIAEQQRLLSDQKVEEVLRTQEVKVMNAMMEGQETERTRIAQDLHDRLGSMLSTIKLQFSALGSLIGEFVKDHRERFDHAMGMVDDAVGEVRRISHGMMRGNIDRFGLKSALQDLASAVETPGRMHVELSLFGLDERLDQKLEIGVYRMVQEMVGNALKHAQASELTIQLTRSDASLNVMVEDNGSGFDTAAAREGLGMGNLRSRAVEFNGSLTVDSRPGRGTSITVEIPLARS